VLGFGSGFLAGGLVAGPTNVIRATTGMLDSLGTLMRDMPKR
jgi:hypothetical protein